MKHVVLGSFNPAPNPGGPYVFRQEGGWDYSADPFPAFWGRRERHQQRAFLPVKGVEPVASYFVESSLSAGKIYEGPSWEAALAAEAEYKNRTGSRDPMVHCAQPTLPEGEFRVIKTREKGTWMVVSGNDTTDRCLLFVPQSVNTLGTKVLPEATTGTVLAQYTKTEVRTTSRAVTMWVIVLLERGQKITFKQTSRRGSFTTSYLWDGNQIKEEEHHG